MQDVHLCMYVCMYVCMYACVYKFHSETQVPLLLFRRSTRSNPLWMFFECRRRGWADNGNVWEGIGVQPWFLKKSFKLWFYNLFIYLLNRKVYSTFFFLKDAFFHDVWSNTLSFVIAGLPCQSGDEFGRSLVPLSLGDFSAVVRAGDR